MGKLYGFRTKKRKDGLYNYEVNEGTQRKKPNKFGQYVDTKVIKEGTRKTRARALGQAKRWVGYLRYKRDKEEIKKKSKLI